MYGCPFHFLFCTLAEMTTIVEWLSEQVLCVCLFDVSCCSIIIFWLLKWASWAVVENQKPIWCNNFLRLLTHKLISFWCTVEENVATVSRRMLHLLLFCLLLLLCFSNALIAFAWTYPFFAIPFFNALLSVSHLALLLTDFEMYSVQVDKCIIEISLLCSWKLVQSLQQQECVQIKVTN